MASKRLGVVIGFALFCALIVFPLTQYQAGAQETRNIQIRAGFEPQFKTTIEPAEIWISPGTAVVWTNWGKSEVSISFPNGKECGEATLKSLGWKSDKGCYITSQFVPFGGTSSLVFEKLGKFDYEVLVGTGAKSVIKGSILVRKFP